MQSSTKMFLSKSVKFPIIEALLLLGACFVFFSACTHDRSRCNREIQQNVCRDIDFVTIRDCLDSVVVAEHLDTTCALVLGIRALQLDGVWLMLTIQWKDIHF